MWSIFVMQSFIQIFLAPNKFWASFLDRSITTKVESYLRGMTVRECNFKCGLTKKNPNIPVF